MMAWRPTDIRDERASSRVWAGERSVPRVAPAPAAYKRPSVPTPLVFAPMTSTYRCGDHTPRPCVLLETTGVGVLREADLCVDRS